MNKVKSTKSATYYIDKKPSEEYNEMDIEDNSNNENDMKDEG